MYVFFDLGILRNLVKGNNKKVIRMFIVLFRGDKYYLNVYKKGIGKINYCIFI